MWPLQQECERDLVLLKSNIHAKTLVTRDLFPCHVQVVNDALRMPRQIRISPGRFLSALCG